MAEEEKSKYNEASFQIFRLHELHLKIEDALSNPNITNKMNKYNFLCDSLWRELSADVYKQSPKKAKKKELKNALYIKKFYVAKTDSERYKVLNERHIFLKRLQEEVGKGGVYSDGREDNFD